jgi:streptogramin lyase
MVAMTRPSEAGSNARVSAIFRKVKGFANGAHTGRIEATVESTKLSAVVDMTLLAPFITCYCNIIARLLVLAVALSTAAASDLPRLRARSSEELTPIATLHVGKTADWVAVTAGSVWVGSTGPYAVHRIDTNTNTSVATVTLPGEPCAGLAIGFGSLWVPLCADIPGVAQIDLASNQLRTIIKVQMVAAESGVTTSPDSVWLVVDKAGALARIDPQTGAVRQIVRIPSGSYNPLYSDGRIWVTRAEGSELTVVDAKTGKVIGSVTTGPHPRFLTSGAGAVWTLNQGDGSLTRVDMRTNRATQTIDLGTPGSGGDINFGDGVVLTTVNKVPLSVIDANRVKLLCRWTGAGGDSLAIGHGSIWLTNYHAGTIARLELQKTLSQCWQSPLPPSAAPSHHP